MVRFSDADASTDADSGHEIFCRFDFYCPVSGELCLLLVERIAPGDLTVSDTNPDAHAIEFMRLLAAHERRLCGYVLAMVPNWNDAEDIIQQTRLRLWEQFDTYDRQKDFGTWACVIARYQVLAFRTRTARSRVRFSQDFIDRVSATFAKAATESDARLTFLEDCFKKLTEWQRNLLWRCCIADDSVRRVASQLGRKTDSIRKALLRTRRNLYRCIEDAQQKEAVR